MTTPPVRYYPTEIDTPRQGFQHERVGLNHDPVVHIWLPAFWFYFAGFMVFAACLLTWLAVKDIETSVRDERAGVASALMDEVERRGLVSAARPCADATVRVLTFGDC
jgi:hypothetical protein